MSVCSGVHSEMKEGGVEREREQWNCSIKRSTERWEAQRESERGGKKCKVKGRSQREWRTAM